MHAFHQGRFFVHLAREAVSGNSSPTEQEVADLVQGELLRLAKAWKRDPERGIKGLG